ncbi:MAG: hypothetical protein GTO22_22580 [Gemmatimonadales bacterium]|nr:hypothetical protein [Gemmatimonadales bacterium]
MLIEDVSLVGLAVFFSLLVVMAFILWRFSRSPDGAAVFVMAALALVALSVRPWWSKAPFILFLVFLFWRMATPTRAEREARERSNRRWRVGPFSPDLDDPNLKN